jgi:hypothetical protein
MIRKNENCDNCPSSIIGDELDVGRCFLSRSIAKRYYDENSLRNDFSIVADSITITPVFIRDNQNQLMEGFSEFFDSNEPRYAEWVKTDSKIASVALKALIDSDDLTHLAECSTSWLRKCQNDGREPLHRAHNSILSAVLEAERFWGYTSGCLDHRR